MDNRFFEYPVSNSPNKEPRLHWELNEHSGFGKDSV